MPRPDVDIVLIEDDTRADLVIGALRAGARAVLPRSAEAADVAAAQCAIDAGLIVLSPEAIDALTAAGHDASDVPAEALTAREREVLELLARGWPNRRIAERLAIAENTVKAHVGAILAKLGAATRTEAVTTGVRLGLIMV